MNRSEPSDNVNITVSRPFRNAKEEGRITAASLISASGIFFTLEKRP